MNDPHEQDAAYLSVLRGQLPSDADKARIRTKLAAAGVGAAAALVPASVQGATLAGKLKLLALSKALIATAFVALLGGALYVASDSPPQEPGVPSADLPAPSASALPRVEPASTTQPAPKPAAKPIAERRLNKRRASPRASLSLDTLGEENALVGAAVKALHAGEMGTAKHLLDEHERRFPQGLLRAERERARLKLVP